jgi:hypothetical protein
MLEKPSKNILNAFGGQLMSIYIPPRKGDRLGERLEANSLKVGGNIFLL